MPGATIAPAASRTKQKVRELVTTGTPKHRHSLRNGFTAYTRSPRSAGLVSLRRLPRCSGRLGASVGAPGPRDFAVRSQHRSSGEANCVHRILRYVS
jgi:hypothetical protein